MNRKQQNAYNTLLGVLTQYGLGSLAKTLLGFVQKGYDAPTINYLIQQTDAWHQRFAGNDIRLKNGLSELDPATYLATEDAYKAVMRNSGLPGGFYDTPDAFAKFIGNNVSASELNDRVTMAGQAVNSVDPNIRTAFQQYYGVGDGHLAAYFLDPKNGEQILQQHAAAANIGAASLDQGLHLTNADDALKYAQMGVSADTAQKAYGLTAQLLPEEQRIAERNNTSYGQQDAESEFLGQNGLASQRRAQLNQREQAMFSGAGGVGNSFYHPDYAFAQQAAGAV